MVNSNNKKNSVSQFGPAKYQNEEREITAVKCLSLLGVSGGTPCAVDSRGGKVIRIRPLHFDSKYDRKQINPWKIEARGKVLEPLMKSLPSPFSMGYKKRAYSPNRINSP